MAFIQKNGGVHKDFGWAILVKAYKISVGEFQLLGGISSKDIEPGDTDQ